jgi:hypothetical protein
MAHFIAYKKSAAFFFLFSKLFLLALIILHFHEINISFEGYSYNCFENPGSGIYVEKFFFNCSIQQFFSTITSDSDIYYSTNLYPGKDLILSISPSDKIYSENLNSNCLRAPPLSL